MSLRVTDVYLLRDHDGRVLYVGVTVSPRTRLASHRRKSWGSQIAAMTIVGTFDRAMAERIEHDTILALQPPHNIASRDGLRAHEMARAVQASFRTLGNHRRFTATEIERVKAGSAA